MRLADYLEVRDESGRAFAARSGIAEGTIRNILAGEWVTMRVARLVVTATGGEVKYEDLTPVGKTPRERMRA